MRSGTSFFDLTVYRKTFTRFWPLWAVNLVFWLFVLPFNGLMQLGDDLGSELKSTGIFRFARNVGDYATELGLVFAVGAGLIVAMAVCSHLYNNRSANFVGSLPIRREGLFVSTYLSGLTMLIAPNVVIFLLTLLVEAAGSAVLWSPLLFWLAALSGMEFFFYSFAVCLGQFAGHVLALPVFYAVFNVLVGGAYVLLNWVMEAFYFGFSEVGTVDGSFVYWCTPAMAFLTMDIDVLRNDAYSMDVDLLRENSLWTVDVEGLWIAAIYAVVAVVLMVCALLLYRRRHLETAGDIVAVKAMRPVFKYGVAACAGLFFGMLMREMFGFTNVGLMIAIVLWGIVGYFVAQMLLDKSIRVFKKWKGAVWLTAAFILLFAVIGLDLTGYETRVPSADEVESVQVVGLYGEPWDSGASLNVELTGRESIAQVVALHEAIVKYGEYGEPGGDETGWKSVQVRYTLKSGRLVARSYNVRFGSELMALGQAIRDNDEVREKTYELDTIENWWKEGAQLEVVTVYRGGESAEIWGTDALQLWIAVMADFEQDNIGIHVLQNDGTQYENFWYPLEDGGTTTCELEFRWSKPREGVVSPEPVSAPEYEKADMTYHYMQIVVLEQSAHTRAALEQMLPADKEPGKTPEDMMAGF